MAVFNNETPKKLETFAIYASRMILKKLDIDESV